MIPRERTNAKPSAARLSWRDGMMRRRALLLAAVAFGLARRALAEDGMADLAGLLDQEKSFAEGGAALLKRWVKKPVDLVRGQRLYNDAKAAAAGAIGYR